MLDDGHPAGAVSCMVGVILVEGLVTAMRLSTLHILAVAGCARSRMNFLQSLSLRSGTCIPRALAGGAPWKGFR